MSELKELIEKIQQLRGYMHNLIITKGDLIDPEIITVSKMIDTLLNEYEKVVQEKNKKE